MAKNNIEGIFNLSPLQEGMYFHAMYSDGDGEYVIQNRFRMNFHVDEDLFEQALQLLAAKHKFLRAAFVAPKTGDKIFQVVLRERKLEFQCFHLTQLSEIQQSEQYDC